VSGGAEILTSLSITAQNIGICPRLYILVVG
jgi:hypothetical protein